jgi:hypothetical protein
VTTITDYSSLQDAVADYLDRTDLTARIPTFIQLAEAKLNAVFEHRDIQSESTLTPVVGSRYIALPTGYRSPQNMWIQWSGSAGRQEMRSLIPEAMLVTTVNSIPQSWAIDGSNIAFNCPCNANGDYSFIFRWLGSIALASAADTNLVLTNYPNVYLFGALREAAPFLRDPDALAMWEAKFEEALMDARAKENRDKALVTLSTEPGGLTVPRRSSFNVYAGY